MECLIRPWTLKNVGAGNPPSKNANYYHNYARQTNQNMYVVWLLSVNLFIILMRIRNFYLFGSTNWRRHCACRSVWFIFIFLLLPLLTNTISSHHVRLRFIYSDCKIRNSRTHLRFSHPWTHMEDCPPPRAIAFLVVIELGNNNHEILWNDILFNHEILFEARGAKLTYTIIFNQWKLCH